MKAVNKILAAGAVVLACGIQNASAAPISATEVIDDVLSFELFDRNLTRTRSDSNGFLDVVTSDATIESENGVDNDFGIYTPEDVGYTHLLTWLNPPAGTFLTASLQIEAFGVDNGNDVVLTDTVNLGVLTNDGSLGEGFTTTIFSSSNPVTLALLLGDGVLNVVINKNATGGGLQQLDFLSVYKSSLTVRYEPVPEPATALLLGGAGLLAWRRKRAA